MGITLAGKTSEEVRAVPLLHITLKFHIGTYTVTG